METVKIKSPVDGSIYAERPVASDQAINAAVERAKAAQVAWAETPIAVRCRQNLRTRPRNVSSAKYSAVIWRK